MGQQSIGINRGVKKRFELSPITDPYASVEFSINQFMPVYQFRVMRSSSSGMCILVKENSAVLDYLKVDDILNMKYNRNELSYLKEYVNIGIKHITKIEKGRYRGNYLVGLAVLTDVRIYEKL